METQQPILDPEEKAHIFSELAPYMERVRVIHAENTPEKIQVIDRLYDRWLRGHGIDEKKLSTMTLMEKLIEADRFDRSDEIMGENDE